MCNADVSGRASEPLPVFFNHAPHTLFSAGVLEQCINALEIVAARGFYIGLGNMALQTKITAR